MKIRLEESIFKSSQEIGEKVLLKLSADRLLAPCYEAVGKTPKEARYGGWEAKGISGHTLGHYMTALALAFESTGKEEYKKRADFIVDELAFLQQDNGYICGFPEKEGFSGVFENPETFTSAGFDLAGWWVPYYTLHKFFRGLIDIYEKSGNQKALSVVSKLGIWVYNTTSTLNDVQRKRVLRCEYGGMNQVLSRLYRITGDERFNKASRFFCEDDLLLPLSEKEDILSGKHANTQIPKIIGALEIYKNCGDTKYLDCAKFFFDTVSENRSYAIGGNSVGEHFHDLNTEPLETNTCETCNSNNMLVLAKELFDIEKNSKYYDYCEKVLYNHILASQDETGMKTYFVGLKSGHFKVFSTLEESFWCCFGSGLENPFTYNSHIFNFDNELYVNLYISATAECEHFSVTLKSEYPNSEIAELVFNTDTEKSVYLRKPCWCDDFSAEYKNKVYTETEKGYVKITGDFKKGDVIKIKLPMPLSVHKKRDNENEVYFTYGGIVLAERLGREKFPDDDHAKGENDLTGYEGISVEPIADTDIYSIGELEFSVDGHRLVPFYEILHERYRVYFETEG